MSEAASLLNTIGATIVLCGGAAGIYHFFTNEKRAGSLLDKRPDKETFYEQLDKGPYKERVKYNLWATRYVKNYIKKHPLHESEDIADVSSAMSKQSCPNACMM
jgi:hypothetical protein